MDSYFRIKNDIGTTMYILDNTNGSDQLFLEYKLGCNDSQMLSFCRQKKKKWRLYDLTKEYIANQETKLWTMTL